MNIVLLSIILFFASSAKIAESSDLHSSLLPSDALSVSSDNSDKKIQTPIDKFFLSSLYFGAGATFEAASFLARLGGGICLISPWSSAIGNECLLLSRLCGSVSQHAFAQVFKVFSSSEEMISSQSSWQLNRRFLSQIPAASNKEKQLLLFLQRRWLAKSSGFSSSLIDLFCPCFGISIQAHPDTCHIYVRNAAKKFSKTYNNRISAWKQALPHPQKFPLILTRPYDLQEYIPFCFAASQQEKIATIVEKAALRVPGINSKVVVDLTHAFSKNIEDREEWLHIWEDCQLQLFQACQENNVNPNHFLCIQRVQQEGIGGIRLLPFANQSKKEIKQGYRFLLERISHFGLSANQVELDRLATSSDPFVYEESAPFVSIGVQSKEEFFSYLETFDQNWKSNHPQKALMVKGTLQMLKGLLTALPEGKWDEIMNCPTRLLIAQLSFLKIKEQLSLLAQQQDRETFFETASYLEQIHADFSALLEVFAPFTVNDFHPLYLKALTSIPENLKQLTSCSIHSSGMTSLAGILKVMEKTLDTPLRILYGENTYFECIDIIEKVTTASCVDKATEEDWKQVDLIIAQFNPALKKIDLPITEYSVEKISDSLHKAFNARNGKPLTLALDSTIDFIDSPRVGQLLHQFQKEIEAGILNVVCFRSGSKFDLFGMDNYCGAPFFVVHNQDSKWAPFDSLVTDPALQADQLSLNWFCLAYQNVIPQLELYRKQIFDNTRTLLNKVPPRLFSKSSDFRIISVDQEPDLAFIDIKTFGPLHHIKGAALVGGCLCMDFMERGDPIFFRPSLGFYHPNFTMIFGQKNTTVRLTLGLDPAQVDLFAKIFETIDALNEPSNDRYWNRMIQSFFPITRDCHLKSLQKKSF